MFNLTLSAKIRRKRTNQQQQKSINHQWGVAHILMQRKEGPSIAISFLHYLFQKLEQQQFFFLILPFVFSFHFSSFLSITPAMIVASINTSICGAPHDLSSGAWVHASQPIMAPRLGDASQPVCKLWVVLDPSQSKTLIQSTKKKERIKKAVSVRKQGVCQVIREW